MFWKRSNNLAGTALFKEPEDNRKSYRVAPAAHAPLKATLEEKEVFVVNISSGGIYLDNDDLKNGHLYSIQLSLPDESEKISASIKILEIDGNNHCRCRFIDLAPKYEDQIHRYALKRQKEDLVKKKKSSAIPNWL